MKSEKQHQVIHMFRAADRMLKRSIEKKVEGTGVYRSQHRLLMELGRHPECSQTELAEKLEISPAAAAVSLKKLEKAGYIMRQCNENDNRINHMIVTEKGKKAIDISISYFKEIENALLDGFTMEELAQMESFLHRIAVNGEQYYQALLKQENNRE